MRGCDVRGNGTPNAVEGYQASVQPKPSVLPTIANDSMHLQLFPNQGAAGLRRLPLRVIGGSSESENLRLRSR
jgi:hypothetical protein